MINKFPFMTCNFRMASSIEVCS